MSAKDLSWRRWPVVLTVVEPRRAELSISASIASCIMCFSLRLMISGAPNSSKRFKRLFRLITRRYKSFKSDAANRPPSNCTIGRKSGGITGSCVKNIHSGRIPASIIPRTSDSRRIMRLARAVEASAISVSSCFANCSKSVWAKILRIASAPIPALKMWPYFNDKSRYSTSEMILCETSVLSCSSACMVAASSLSSSFFSSSCNFSFFVSRLASSFGKALRSCLYPCLIAARLDWYSLDKRSISLFFSSSFTSVTM